METILEGTAAEVDRILDARVARGAAVLDRVEPGWERRIVLDQLAMETCHRCILGQLHGSYTRGMSRVSAGLPPEYGLVSATAHGFTLHDQEQTGVPRVVAYEWFGRLGEAWRRLIQGRLAGRPTPL